MNTDRYLFWGGKKEKIKIVFSLLKIIYFNFKVFDFKTAIFFPVVLSYNTKIRKISKGDVILDNWEPFKYYIKLGFGGSIAVASNKNSEINIASNGQIRFKGSAVFAEGCILDVQGGELSFGDNVSANKNCTFECRQKIEIQDSVLMGYHINFRDSDGHLILDKNGDGTINKNISVGRDTWICSYVDILKGTTIEQGSVIAWGSTLVNKQYCEKVLLGGAPAKILKRDIAWIP